MTVKCIGIRKFIGHNWDTWDIPVQSERIVSGLFATYKETVSTQTRRCKLCGFVEFRTVSINSRQPVEDGGLE